MKAVIIIPGYKGSFLKEKESGKRIWLSHKELFFGQSDLRYNSGGFFEADGLFDRFVVIPRIYEVKIYHNLINTLKKNGVVVIPFAYDWRSDLFSQLVPLKQLVISLKEKGFSQVNVIGHSMGGLILFYLLRYGDSPIPCATETWSGASLIDKAVFCGTPFKGTLKAFRDIHLGSKVGFNKKLLNPRVTSSFPVAYELLPESHSKHVFLVDKDHLVNPVDLYSAYNWIKYGMGPFRYASVEQVKHFLSFIEDKLKAGQAFFERINQTPETKMPSSCKILNLVGNGIPTYDKYFWNVQRSRIILKKIEYEQFGLIPGDSFSQGDGTVTASSADFPINLGSPSVEQVYVKAYHEGYFRENKVPSLILKHFDQ